jgi:predicted negative regulator of RcsB-dependent stress response
VDIILGYDPTTLREQVDLQAAGDRLAELENRRDTESINEKVALLRMVGRIDDAWDAANAALRNARMTGDRESICRARIRRAQVQQEQGKLEDARRELTACIDEARTHDWAATEAFALQHRGKVLFDHGDFAGALQDFRTAAAMRERIGAPDDQVQSSLFAAQVVESRL